MTANAPSSLIRMTIRLCRRLLVLDRLGRLGPPGAGLSILIFCVVLAAMIFGLVHAVVYFTDSTDAAARAAAKSAMAMTTDKAFLVAP